VTLAPQDTATPAAAPADADPRFPWKARGTRKPLTAWQRVRYLLLFAAVFEVLVWTEYLKFSPAESWLEAQRQVAWSQPWPLWLAGLEVLRQLHLFVSERSARYHRFWSERVFGRYNRWSSRRFSDWTRYKAALALKVVFLLVLAAIVLGKIVDTSPALALFKAPALLVAALPLVLQLLFAFFFVIFQFVGIFWFLSRGGVEVYHPEDVKTRFTDVWGQDHVVDRLKENMVLLERPEDIESRGGHVPSGILLWGPPGTGKTLMAEAVAGETGKPFVFVDPGAFTNMFMGVGILKVKGLFRKLRRLALRYGGVIVFFDEADVLGSRSMSMGQPGVFGATGAAAAAASCSGYDHLSPHSRAAVAALSTPPGGAHDRDAAERGRDRVVVGAGMGGGGGGGTLQALLTELSGLKKPRGIFNRFLRRALLMQPKPPPKYRILVMMATNLPDALDPALMRPGRIDRKYRVGYPNKAGRLRTFEGYLSKVRHELTPEQVDKLATITAYRTGADIKDIVNEALVYAIREGHDTITWRDMINAKHLKELGPSENVEYIERERHAVAVHEACHAAVAWHTRHHMDIDIATIDKGSTYLGMVSSIPPEDQFTEWRSEYEADILVSLASLAGERLFFDGDNSSGVSGDLYSATLVAGLMESHWGMGKGVSALPALQQLGINGGVPDDKRRGGGGIGFGAQLVKRDEGGSGALGQRIESALARLLVRAEEILEEHRVQVLALAHALETHKTLSGDDVVAVLEGRQGPIVDGRVYRDPAFAAELEAYHAAALDAHRGHAPIAAPLPAPRHPEGESLPGEDADSGDGAFRHAPAPTGLTPPPAAGEQGPGAPLA
jgi:ATP-dependent Zn protease